LYGRALVAHRFGYYAAWTLTCVGAVYAMVVAVGIAQAGQAPIVDPVFAVMEILTFLAAVLIVIVLASLYDYASPDRKLSALIALSFGIAMAGLTSGVHFVALSAGRQTGLTTLEWPSTLYAVELLAWDVFLGLALLFASLVFAGPGSFPAVRWALTVTGALCLLGAIGPLVGDMALQRVGIVGYGVGLPISSALLASAFRRGPKPLSSSGSARHRIGPTP
jgi:hypothetical protein